MAISVCSCANSGGRLKHRLDRKEWLTVERLVARRTPAGSSIPTGKKSPAAGGGGEQILLDGELGGTGKFKWNPPAGVWRAVLLEQCGR